MQGLCALRSVLLDLPAACVYSGAAWRQRLALAATDNSPCKEECGTAFSAIRRRLQKTAVTDIPRTLELYRVHDGIQVQAIAELQEIIA